MQDIDVVAHDVIMSPVQSDMLSLNTVSSTHYLSAESASIRWLRLLAADAAQADQTFSLTPFVTPARDMSQDVSLQGNLINPSHQFSSSLNGILYDDSVTEPNVFSTNRLDALHC